MLALTPVATVLCPSRGRTTILLNVCTRKPIKRYRKLEKTTLYLLWNERLWNSLLFSTDRKQKQIQTLNVHTAGYITSTEHAPLRSHSCPMRELRLPACRAWSGASGFLENRERRYKLNCTPISPSLKVTHLWIEPEISTAAGELIHAKINKRIVRLTFLIVKSYSVLP